MARKKDSGVQPDAQKPLTGPGSGHKVPEGVPFTRMTAKQAQEASVRARNLRKQVRAQMLDTLVTNMDFGNEMLKAVRQGDMDKISLLQTALKIVGLTHDQSEEAVQKIALDAKTDNKTDTTIHFTLGKKPEAAPKE